MDLMTPPEAADYLKQQHGVTRSVGTLAVERCHNAGPTFRKIGRAVVYAPADLDAWVAARRAGGSITARRESVA